MRNLNNLQGVSGPAYFLPMTLKCIQLARPKVILKFTKPSHLSAKDSTSAATPCIVISKDQWTQSGEVILLQDREDNFHWLAFIAAFRKNWVRTLEPVHFCVHHYLSQVRRWSTGHRQILRECLTPQWTSPFSPTHLHPWETVCASTGFPWPLSSLLLDCSWLWNWQPFPEQSLETCRPHYRSCLESTGFHPSWLFL